MLVPSISGFNCRARWRSKMLRLQGVVVLHGGQNTPSTDQLSILNRAGGCGVGFHSIHERVLLKSVVSIVVNRNSFYRSTQPTYCWSEKRMAGQVREELRPILVTRDESSMHRDRRDSLSRAPGAGAGPGPRMPRLQWTIPWVGWMRYPWKVRSTTYSGP